MNGFDDWLAAMPVADVRRQIVKLEQEREELDRQADVLRVLLAQRGEGAPPLEPDAPAVRRPVKRSSRPPYVPGRRLSPQRDAILSVLRARPDGATPQEITAALGTGASPNSVGTNLSRMSKSGMVARVSTGLYKLPPTTPTEAASVAQNGTLLLDTPSGSDEGAMRP